MKDFFKICNVSLNYISYIVRFCLIFVVPAELNIGKVILQSDFTTFPVFLGMKFKQVNQITQDYLLNQIIVLSDNHDFKSDCKPED